MFKMSKMMAGVAALSLSAVAAAAPLAVAIERSGVVVDGAEGDVRPSGIGAAYLIAGFAAIATAVVLVMSDREEPVSP